MAEERPKINFRDATRQRVQKVDTRAFVAGASITPMRIAKIGYLSRLWINLTGTVDSSGAVTAAKDNPWSLLKRIKLELNAGNQNIIDTSGFGLFVMNHFLSEGFAPNDGGGGGNGITDNDVYRFELNDADETLTYNLWWELPISANAGENFQVGLLMLQAPELEATLEIDFGSLAEFGTAISAITGTLSVYEEYYDVPNPQIAMLPPPKIHRIVEESQPITAVGENKFDLKRQGVLLQLIMIIEMNSVRNHADVDTIELTFNESDRVYRFDRALVRHRQRLEKGVGFPTGVLSFDFWNANGLVSNGDTRDAIDTEAIALTTVKVDVNSGATLGSNASKVRFIRRIIQNLR